MEKTKQFKMITVSRETRDTLMNLKYKLNAKSIDEIVKKLIFIYQNDGNIYKGKQISEKADIEKYG